MREIKFRQLIETQGGEKIWHYWGMCSCLGESSLGCASSPKLGYESQQFTGLLDKNEKEIYEGDILASFPIHKKNGSLGWGNKEIVTFSLDKRADSEYGGSYYGYLFDFDDISYYEVIGNIYEDSNLLPVIK